MNEHRFTRPSLRVVAAAFAAALLAAGIAHAAAGHVKRHHAAHAKARVADATDALPFAVLSRPADPADLENAAVVKSAKHEPALQPSQARVLDIGSWGRSWLIPTSDGRLCLGMQPAGQYVAREQERGLEHLEMVFACAPIVTAETDGITVRLYEEVVGLAPDGVSSVASALGGGQPATEEVEGNTYRFSVPEGFQEGTVTFDLSDGAEETEPF